MQKGMSKERLIQSIALGANCVTILGLLLVIVQLQQNRALMRAHFAACSWCSAAFV
jgi:hypothetical protein